MEAINQLIGGLLDASPPFLLAFVLWVLGEMMKRVPQIQNWAIPFVMAIAGAGIYPFVAEVGKTSYQVRSPWMLNVLIGFGIGAAPVMVDQMRKQWGEFKKNKAADSDTKFLVRDADVPKPPPTPANPLPAEPPPKTGETSSTPGLP